MDCRWLMLQNAWGGGGFVTDPMGVADLMRFVFRLSCFKPCMASLVLLDRAQTKFLVTRALPEAVSALTPSPSPGRSALLESHCP